MSLVMERIGEYGMINLMIWVVALSSKQKWSYNEQPVSKRKAKIVVAFTSKCRDGEQLFFKCVS